jgi:hypothetical protein
VPTKTRDRLRPPFLRGSRMCAGGGREGAGRRVRGEKRAKCGAMSRQGMSILPPSPPLLLRPLLRSLLLVVVVVVAIKRVLSEQLLGSMAPVAKQKEGGKAIGSRKPSHRLLKMGAEVGEEVGEEVVGERGQQQGHSGGWLEEMMIGPRPQRVAEMYGWMRGGWQHCRGATVGVWEQGWPRPRWLTAWERGEQMRGIRPTSNRWPFRRRGVRDLQGMGWEELVLGLTGRGC